MKITTAQIITALQTVNSRQTAPTTPVVVTIGSIHGGTKHNIIPAEVRLQGTVRVLDMKTAEQVKAQVRRVVENTAAAIFPIVKVLPQITAVKNNTIFAIVDFFILCGDSSNGMIERLYHR